MQRSKGSLYARLGMFWSFFSMLTLRSVRKEMDAPPSKRSVELYRHHGAFK